jgi:hypothetical protein
MTRSINRLCVVPMTIFSAVGLGFGRVGYQVHDGLVQMDGRTFDIGKIGIQRR